MWVDIFASKDGTQHRLLQCSEQYEESSRKRAQIDQMTPHLPWHGWRDILWGLA